jgi:hypothetical protein
VAAESDNLPRMEIGHVLFIDLVGYSRLLIEEQKKRLNFGAIARDEFGKWLDPELTEHLIDGLRKAGLTVDREDHVVRT